jgi:hypothetical protein
MLFLRDTVLFCIRICTDAVLEGHRRCSAYIGTDTGAFLKGTGTDAV